VFVAIVVAAVLVFAWRSPIDTAAEAQVDAGLKRALATFAVARALNAVISFAQGTEIEVGIGASATLSVGEVLDPLNDLVEQFSNLMLLACVSFGIQKLLLEIGQHWIANALVTATGLAWLALYLLRIRPPPLVTTCFVLGLMVRFSVPLSTMATDAIYRTWLEPTYQTNTTALAAATDQFRPTAASAVAADAPHVAAPTTPPSAESRGTWDRLKNWIKKQADAAQALPEKLSPSRAVETVKSEMEDLKVRAEAAAQRIIDLTVVFLLQTVVVPVAMLLILYVLSKNAVRSVGLNSRSELDTR
jgi:hypothetical protein